MSKNDKVTVSMKKRTNYYSHNPSYHAINHLVQVFIQNSINIMLVVLHLHVYILYLD